MTKMSIYSNQNNVMIFELKDRTVKGFPLKYILGTWNCIAWQKLYSIDHLESFKLMLCFLNAGLCICTFGIGYILKQKVIYVSEPSEKRNIKMRSVWGRETEQRWQHSFTTHYQAIPTHFVLFLSLYIQSYLYFVKLIYFFIFLPYLSFKNLKPPVHTLSQEVSADNVNLVFF